MTKVDWRSRVRETVGPLKYPERNLCAPAGGVALKVSVCLLTYNHDHLIAKVLESILAQTYRDFELIVSDDCSTDGTWELIQRIAQNDPRARPVRTPRNLGMAGNANFAIGLSRGEFVALLHHDDLVAPTLLAEWVRVAEEHPSVGFVFNDYATGSPFDHKKLLLKRIMPGQWFLSHQLLARWGCLVRGTALIRRACFHAVGGMNERFSYLADVDLWMRLAARWDVGYVAKGLISVRHDRKAGYPREYVEFTWHRLRLLHEIHGTNLQSQQKTLGRYAALRWAIFRVKVSFDELKWVGYAVVKRKWWMIQTSEEGIGRYEYRIVGIVRWVVSRVVERLRLGGRSQAC